MEVKEKTLSGKKNIRTGGIYLRTPILQNLCGRSLRSILFPKGVTTPRVRRVLPSWSEAWSDRRTGHQEKWDV